MPLFFHRSESNTPGYSVMFRADDGRELYVGRIFKSDGLPWMWSVEFSPAQGPH